MNTLATEPVRRPSVDNPLEELGEKYLPTKRMHDYLKHYWRHFHDYRETATNVIELGVETGASLRMWAEFFPKATIHGLDINPECKRHEADRIRVHIGDQSNEADLRAMVESLDAPPEIIIDDGSHYYRHQISAFNMLFPVMATHAVYAIEDVGAHPNPDRLNTFAAVAPLVANINYWPGYAGLEDWPKIKSFDDQAGWLDRHVVGMAIYRYLVFVMKGRNPEDNPYLALT